MRNISCKVLQIQEKWNSIKNDFGERFKAIAMLFMNIIRAYLMGRSNSGMKEHWVAVIEKKLFANVSDLSALVIDVLCVILCFNFHAFNARLQWVRLANVRGKMKYLQGMHISVFINNAVAFFKASDGGKIRDEKSDGKEKQINLIV